MNADSVKAFTQSAMQASCFRSEQVSLGKFSRKSFDPSLNRMEMAAILPRIPPYPLR